MIARIDYINYLNKFKDMPLIKVISGVRRCGKSTLFLQYIEHLKSNNIDDNHIIFINFEDLEYEEYTNYKTLYNYLNKRIIDSKKYYIFLDEIQNVEKYEKTVDSLLVKGNCDILAGIHMTKGIIEIDGDVNRWPGGQMKNGNIVIHGFLGRLLEGFVYEGLVEDPEVDGEVFKGKYIKYTGDIVYDFQRKSFEFS